MRTILRVINVMGCYGGLGLVFVYLAANWFVLRDAQVQEFILAWGESGIFGLISSSLIAGGINHRLETSRIPSWDGAAFGFLGAFALLTLFMFVAMDWQSRSVPGWVMLVALASALFLYAVSFSFAKKAEGYEICP